MDTPEYSESFLLDQFREFYGEVIRLKQMVGSGTWVFAVEGASEGAPDPAKAANFVWQRLLSLLEQQEIAAVRKGGEYWTTVFEEAQYVMAVLADEIFLHLDWMGREVWNSNLLESRLFHSHGAGEIFFQKLDRLLQNRDPVYVDLAKVYLMALGLGFQGKFRGTGDSRLDDYRRKLFSYIARRDPDLLDESRRLFPDASVYTLDEGSQSRLPDIRPWVGALIAVLLILIAIGHGIWLNSTAELRQVIEQILIQK